MRKVVGGVVAVLALLLAACGEGGGSGSVSGSASGSGTGSGTGSPSASAGADVDTPAVSIEGKVNAHGEAKVAGDAGELELEADDFYFAPTFVAASPGATITVKLHNEGTAPHTFTIDALDVNEQLEPGAEATVEVDLPDEGPVVFYCNFHRAQGMQGAFHFES